MAFLLLYDLDHFASFDCLPYGDDVDYIAHFLLPWDRQSRTPHLQAVPYRLSQSESQKKIEKTSEKNQKKARFGATTLGLPLVQLIPCRIAHKSVHDHDFHVDIVYKKT